MGVPNYVECIQDHQSLRPYTECSHYQTRHIPYFPLPPTAREAGTREEEV